jgi:[ribosomal protein S18]-alanine N-acetyltransferase
VNAKFRLAAAADIGALVDLENRSFSSDRISRKSFSRLVASPSAAVIIASIGQSVAGYAVVLFRAGSAAARIYSLAVNPTFRGIGRELLAACEGEAAIRGCSAVRLEVREDNVRAINLYERMAYSRFAAKPGYYADGATALRFAKPIAPRATSTARLAGTAAA